MHIVHISDTHGKHRDLSLPAGDVLIHSGDFSQYAIDVETVDFLDWFRGQPFKHKIMIAGNHDKTLSDCNGDELKHYDFDGIHYLNGGAVVIDGIKFYGSPQTPSDFLMPFTYFREDAEEAWQDLPVDIDVLITHGPINGVLDSGYGCHVLKDKVDRMADLKAHLFGHIHESTGLLKIEGTFFSNAAQSVHLIALD